MKNVKRQVGVDIEENNTNSQKFSKDIKSILGAEKKLVKKPLTDHLNNQEICEKMKSNFSNICTHLHPIDATQLPSFLPSFEPPTTDRIIVYNILLSLKVGKASPPNTLSK